MSSFKEEIYKNLLISEDKNLFDYTSMSRQPYLNEKMRYILLDWIISVLKKIGNDMEVLFLTGALIDKLIERKKTIIRNRFQLIGVVALRLAYKYEENYDLTVDDCVYYCDDAYTREECLQMEKTILEVLDYSLTFPTSYTFLNFYLDHDVSNDSTKKFAIALLIKILPEYSMLIFKPSIIASSVIYFSKKYVKSAPYWSVSLRKLTEYKVKDLTVCLAEIKKITSTMDLDVVLLSK